MKLALCLLIIALSACAPTRVLVKDCQDLQGNDLKNCELIQRL